MIVNVGKRIKVETEEFEFECDADAPRKIKVRKTGYEQVFELPRNADEAEIFMKAYRRCLAEDIEYRELCREPIDLPY